ncbi:DUF5753 domain-containing protein [Actinomadura adrarensis]|uniref:DUF5753 domain-containing protein n=1 Tax=Actinomadura adrarensis TaxID=1819600 RepID=A0ABW3CQ56_9ACTN
MTETYDGSNPDDLRAHFAQELRRLRLRQGLSMAKLAEALGCTPQWICQMEKVDKAVSEQTALDLDTFFKTDGWEENDGHFHRMYTAIRLANRRRVLLPGFDAYLDHEGKANGIRCFAAQVVPGLLQTEDYMRGLMNPSASEETLDARVAGRVERQTLLARDKPPVMTFVLDESVLRRPVGGSKVMVEQIDHLIGLAQSPMVRVHVMPFTQVTPSALIGGFILLNFEKETDLLYSESGGIGRLVDDRHAVFQARVDFDMILAEALNQAESLKLMNQARETYK